MFLVRVKTPEESRAAGDLYEVLATIPGKEAFASVENSACPLVKK
jgi:branched-chain amino acid transport system substrate-binding protein